VVLAITAFTVVAGYFAQKKLPRDAIPDLSDPQIVLIAEWMGRPASEVAAKVTDVVTAELSTVPHATAVRGASMSGMSYVDVVFDDSSALSPGRAEIAKRMERLESQLPRGVRVRVGPEASSTGWIFQYALMPPPQGRQMMMAETKKPSTRRKPRRWTRCGSSRTPCSRRSSRRFRVSPK
jgi:Cu(I)/Ag(I) efflux system membrane protein CusA/SilA